MLHHTCKVAYYYKLLKNVSYTLTHTCIFCLTGHGFKLSPVVGNVIAELVMEENPSYDLSPFRLNRFKFSVTIDFCSSNEYY